jgi:hypothetical protein
MAGSVGADEYIYVLCIILSFSGGKNSDEEKKQ